MPNLKSGYMTKEKLSEAEMRALQIAAQSPLVSRIPERNTKDVFGDVEPGLNVYRKLEKLGLLIITEEDLIDDQTPEMGCWTQMVFLTEKGEIALEDLRKRHQI